MARRHDRQARDFGPGPRPESTGTLREARASAANDNRKSGPRYTSALPCDALAFIAPVPLAANPARRARADMWRLRFSELWPPRFVLPPRCHVGGGPPPPAQIPL